MRTSRKARQRLQKKRKKQNKKMALTIVTSLLVTSQLNFPAYAYTVDDLRELQGKDRLDTKYSEEEKSEIWLNWYRTEYRNNVAKMMQNVSLEDLVEAPKRKRDALGRELQALQKDFANRFTSGASVREVLAGYSAIQTKRHELTQVKEVGEVLRLDVVPNEWESLVEDIQAIEEEVQTYQSLGDVGSSLKSPAFGNFHLTSIYGLRADPFNGTLAMHRGIDLGAPVGTPVLAAWNGTVADTYRSERGGNVIVIDHGNGLVTKYMHLDEIEVEPGQAVKQYDRIGTVGDTGRVTGAHLHFEVHLDGESVDPIYFFGKMGANALKDYLSRNLEERNEQTEALVSAIMDKPLHTTDTGGSSGSSGQIYIRDGEVPDGAVDLKLEEGYEVPAPKISKRDWDSLLDSMRSDQPTIRYEGESTANSSGSSAPMSTPNSMHSNNSESSDSSLPSASSMREFLKIDGGE